eukprot:c11707_g1_i1.p1 GENE.c11707_g1_i1~~c11707_g1_i1.p1  ORF type:complete len:884 (+),score=257.38 c11707_g1_i1:133-2784(+)
MTQATHKLELAVLCVLFLVAESSFSSVQSALVLGTHSDNENITNTMLPVDNNNSNQFFKYSTLTSQRGAENDEFVEFLQIEDVTKSVCDTNPDALTSKLKAFASLFVPYLNRVSVGDELTTLANSENIDELATPPNQKRNNKIDSGDAVVNGASTAKDKHKEMCGRVLKEKLHCMTGNSKIGNKKNKVVAGKCASPGFFRTADRERLTYAAMKLQFSDGWLINDIRSGMLAKPQTPPSQAATTERGMGLLLMNLAKNPDALRALISNNLTPATVVVMANIAQAQADWIFDSSVARKTMTIQELQAAMAQDINLSPEVRSIVLSNLEAARNSLLPTAMTLLRKYLSKQNIPAAKATLLVKFLETGRVTKNDLAAFTGASESDVDQLFQVVDATGNSDGTVTYAELREWVLAGDKPSTDSPKNPTTPQQQLLLELESHTNKHHRTLEEENLDESQIRALFINFIKETDKILEAEVVNLQTFLKNKVPSMLTRFQQKVAFTKRMEQSAAAIDDAFGIVGMRGDTATTIASRIKKIASGGMTWETSVKTFVWGCIYFSLLLLFYFALNSAGILTSANLIDALTFGKRTTSKPTTAQPATTTTVAGNSTLAFGNVTLSGNSTTTDSSTTASSTTPGLSETDATNRAISSSITAIGAILFVLLFAWFYIEHYFIWKRGGSTTLSGVEVGGNFGWWANEDMVALVPILILSLPLFLNGIAFMQSNVTVSTVMLSMYQIWAVIAALQFLAKHVVPLMIINEADEATLTKYIGHHTTDPSISDCNEPMPVCLSKLFTLFLSRYDSSYKQCDFESTFTDFLQDTKHRRLTSELVESISLMSLCSDVHVAGSRKALLEELQQFEAILTRVNSVFTLNLKGSVAGERTTERILFS